MEIVVLCHPTDSQAWPAIDEKFSNFASEPRNLQLGILADEVDVDRGNRNHSVWPILIFHLQPSPMVVYEEKVYHAFVIDIGNTRKRY